MAGGVSVLLVVAVDKLENLEQALLELDGIERLFEEVARAGAKRRENQVLVRGSRQKDYR